VSTQAVLVEVGALALLVSTFMLVRRRLLSIRYGLGWLTVAVAGVAAGPLLGVFALQAKKIGFTPTGFSLGVFIVFLILLCLQLSVSLSGLHGAVQELSEHAALLEERVRRLERSPRRDADANARRGYARMGEPE
jgi:Na+/melibiose symporter-like transporter